MVYHGLLDGVERTIFAAQMLDSDDMGAMEASDETDAGGDAVINDVVAGQPAHQDRAGAAIALGATFLGAPQAALKPKPVQKGQVRRNVGESDLLAIENEADGIGDLHHCSTPPIG